MVTICKPLSTIMLKWCGFCGEKVVPKEGNKCPDCNHRLRNNVRESSCKPRRNRY